MDLVYDKDNILIFNGDCREVLKELDQDFFHAVVTDPPYGLEFMGKGWDKGVPGQEFWKEILRVSRPGAPLLSFGGTRTFHRLTCAIEDSGYEIRDCMMWLYGQGFPKSLDISKALDKTAGAEREIVGTKAGLPGYSLTPRGQEDVNTKSNKAYGWSKTPDNPEAECSITAPSTDLAKLWNGYGTALKPAWEPIILAMKPCEGTFAENAAKWGVAGLNIDGSRVEFSSKKDDVRIGKDYKHRAASGLKQNKNNSDGEETSLYKNKGRFPANLILDEESGKVLDEQSGFTTSPNKVKRWKGGQKGRFHPLNDERIVSAPGDSGGASRFFYCAKASKKDRGEFNNHPTVKPSSLMDYLVNLVKPPKDGIILDPFMGSGSTLLAAKRLGIQAIGIDLNKEYCDIAIKRLESK